MIGRLFVWYICVMGAALLYVRAIRITSCMRHKSGGGRLIALAAWMRMLIAGGILVFAMFSLPLFHFILITILFIIVVWIRIWYVTTKR